MYNKISICFLLFYFLFQITIVTQYIQYCSKYDIQPTKYVLDYLDNLSKQQEPSIFDLSSNSRVRLSESKVVKPTLRLQFRSIIPCLQLLPTISHIDVSYQQMTDELLYNLLSVLYENNMAQQITYFNVSGNNLSSVAFSYILQLFDNTNIQNILFDDNDLKNSSLQFLQQYNLPNLQELSIRNCQLRPDSFTNITKFIKNKQCIINLSDNDLNIQNYDIMGFIELIQELKISKCSLNIDNCKLSKYQIDLIQYEKADNQQLKISFLDNIGYNLSNNVDVMQYQVQI